MKHPLSSVAWLFLGLTVVSVTAKDRSSDLRSKAHQTTSLQEISQDATEEVEQLAQQEKDDKQTTELILNGVANIFGSFLNIVSDPNNPTTVGANVANMFGSLFNIAIGTMNKKIFAQTTQTNILSYLGSLDEKFEDQLYELIITKAQELEQMREAYAQTVANKKIEQLKQEHKDQIEKILAKKTNELKKEYENLMAASLTEKLEAIKRECDIKAEQKISAMQKQYEDSLKKAIIQKTKELEEYYENQRTRVLTEKDTKMQKECADTKMATCI